MPMISPLSGLSPLGHRGGKAHDPCFIITVDTTKAGSASDTFVLPTDGSSTYDYYVDWGDGGAEAHVTVNTSQTKVYAASGTYQIKIRGTFPHIYFNNGGDKLKLISIDNWGDIAWGSFLGAFYGCSNMDCAASDNADTSEVTSFYSTFRDCSSLTTLDTSGWNTANVTSFHSIFYGCSSLMTIDTSGWNTAEVTLFFNAFRACSSLKTLDTSGWDTAKVTSFDYAFRGCSSLTTLDTSGWDTAKVTSFDSAFRGCSSLKGDFSAIKLTVATNVANMFASCNINATGTTTNYDKLLVAWAAADVPNSLSFNGGTSKYSVAGGGTTARASLGTDDLWIIADGGQL